MVSGAYDALASFCDMVDNRNINMVIHRVCPRIVIVLIRVDIDIKT